MKLVMTIVLAVCCQVCFAQDDLYLMVEFMKVDNEQSSAYAETENFWEKIHEISVKSGEKLSWDLWALDAGETQSFQFMTVQMYDDPAKMMEGGTWESLMTNAKKAYPDMSEEQITKKIEHSAKTRDLAVRIYLHVIDRTTGDFEMPVGTVARMNAMRALPGKGQEYVKMESEIFKPIHQKEVDNGNRAHWGLATQISPTGSDIYATHFTFDMYKDYAQMFSGQGYDGPEFTEAQQKQIQDGIATRDLRRSTMMKMIKRVRQEPQMTDN